MPPISHHIPLKGLIKEISQRISATTDQELKSFIAQLPEAKNRLPTSEFEAENHFVAFRRYTDIITQENLLEIWIGKGSERIGYLRLDPEWQEAKDRPRKLWEITRAYVRPKYRGYYYSRFMTELAMELARKYKAVGVVAYPRHVAMLITLIDFGFKTDAGVYDSTLQRIVRQARRWYGKNPNARRLYYAQEFRPIIQEGSFIMEKLFEKKKGLWHWLWEKV